MQHGEAAGSTGATAIRLAQSVAKPSKRLTTEQRMGQRAKSTKSSRSNRASRPKSKAFEVNSFDFGVENTLK